jgi:Mlc titration factor MtfA (ptsG expression regulator)
MSREITLILFGMAIASIAIAILAYPLFVKLRRDRLMSRPFPAHWLGIIESNLRIYPYLSALQRRQLQGCIQVLLAEKQFIGCLGLRVTEEMKIAIVAIASLLLLNQRGEYFPNLRSILVYPGAYVVTETVMDESNVVEERRVARLGESWTRDQLILAWEQVQQDTRNWNDGFNVVLHEFAHQLDQEDGRAEGVPVLPRELDYAMWAKVMSSEYLQLREDIQRGAKTVMDSYGATNPAEFFAVATETFFEKPRQLIQKHRNLYELLQRYYQVDPVQWG